MLPARHQISSGSFHLFDQLIEARNREFKPEVLKSLRPHGYSLVQRE